MKPKKMFAKDADVSWKMKRLRQGAVPRVLDLFAGCGGISLGFRTAGFELLGGVEIDANGAATHGLNFFFESLRTGSVHAISRDIHHEPTAILGDLGIKSSASRAVDALVGGPPCQAFARVGRAKLRSEARRQNARDAEEAFLQDGRADLVWQYLRIVKELRPLVILLENVPDMLNFGGENVAEAVSVVLEDYGYRAGYTLLNSAFYGVPQTRERMYLLAYRREIDAEIEWPAPTHHCLLPAGYGGTRATALKHVRRKDRAGLLRKNESNHYHEVPFPDSALKPATTAFEAVGDLPKIMALEELEAGRLRRGARNLSVLTEYPGTSPETGYARLMRGWLGFESSMGVTAHVIRFLPRDYKIFRAMQEGWQYPQVWEWVESRRNKMLKARAKRGLTVDGRNSEVKQILRDWTLPYDRYKFPNKWWKLYRDEPSRTLLAHLGKDSYSHIHYDSEQARTISVREAARLQSFPDGFQFCGSMNAAFRQIGNAVPPLMSYALAMTIRHSLGLSPVRDVRLGTLIAEEKSRKRA